MNQNILQMHQLYIDSNKSGGIKGLMESYGPKPRLVVT